MDPFGDPFEEMFGRPPRPRRGAPKLLVEALAVAHAAAGRRAARPHLLPLHADRGLRPPVQGGAAVRRLLGRGPRAAAGPALRARRRRVEGESYRRFPILRKLLFPTKAGTLTIPAATFRIGLARQGFFDAGGVVERATKPVTVDGGAAAGRARLLGRGGPLPRDGQPRPRRRAARRGGDAALPRRGHRQPEVDRPRARGRRWPEPRSSRRRRRATCAPTAAGHRGLAHVGVRGRAGDERRRRGARRSPSRTSTRGRADRDRRDARPSRCASREGRWRPGSRPRPRPGRARAAGALPLRADLDRHPARVLALVGPGAGRSRRPRPAAARGPAGARAAVRGPPGASRAAPPRRARCAPRSRDLERAGGEAMSKEQAAVARREGAPRGLRRPRRRGRERARPRGAGACSTTCASCATRPSSGTTPTRCGTWPRARRRRCGGGRERWLDSRSWRRRSAALRRRRAGRASASARRTSSPAPATTRRRSPSTASWRRRASESASLYWNWAQAATARGAHGEALWALLRARELDPGDRAVVRDVERLRESLNLDPAEIAPEPLAAAGRLARRFRLDLVALVLLAPLPGRPRRSPGLGRARGGRERLAWVALVLGLLAAAVPVAASLRAPDRPWSCAGGRLSSTRPRPRPRPPARCARARWCRSSRRAAPGSGSRTTPAPAAGRTPPTAWRLDAPPLPPRGLSRPCSVVPPSS